jgi:hypothetical protein
VAAPFSRTIVDPERRSRTAVANLARRASPPGTKARVEHGVKAHNPQVRTGNKAATRKNGSKGNKAATLKNSNKVATLKSGSKGNKAATLKSDSKGNKAATLKNSKKVGTRKNGSKGNKAATPNQTPSERDAIVVKPLVKASPTKIAVRSRIAVPSSNVPTRPVGRKMSTARQDKVLETAIIRGTSSRASSATTSSSKGVSGTTNNSKDSNRINGRTRLAGA